MMSERVDVKQSYLNHCDANHYGVNHCGVAAVVQQAPKVDGCREIP